MLTDLPDSGRIVNIGGKERTFVLVCQNLVVGKGWKEVVAFAKQNMVDRGLLQRVVKIIYMEAPEQRVTNRIKSAL